MSRVVLCDDARVTLVALLRDQFPDSTVCVISDENVARVHASAIAAQVPRARLITFAPGEKSKSRAEWARLTDAMLDARLGRDTVVVAIGGGVTADLAGFVAATYMRGVPIVHVPTSLVAMVDAAIGGKTAIDVPGGKNLVGAFHQPSAVLIDPAFLRTLPEVHVREGLVEALKHGAIADAAYFEWIRTSAPALARDGGPDAPAVAWRLVEHSVNLKMAVVEEDPLEQARRASLNFGHTIGHAVEQAHGYAVSHGVAVAHGMIAEAKIGEAIGVSELGTAARIEEAVRALGIGAPPRCEAEQLRRFAAADKKNRAGAIRMTLLRHVGEVARARDGRWTHEVAPEYLKLVQ